MQPSTADRKTILVVEDERLVAKDLQHTLMKFGYDVPKTVATSEDAIAAVSERCPDLVLMDIRIRGQPDGIETARLLRSRFDVPVIYLTAHADQDTVARARTTEPFGYLLKPVNPQALSGAVETALYKHEMDRRLRERERWYSTALQSIRDAVISTDAAGQVTFMNPVAESLTGWRAEDAKGRPLANVVRLMGKIANRPGETPATLLREKQVVQLEPCGAPQDQKGAIADSATPLVDDSGDVVGAVWVFRDMSEQIRLQSQLELSDRLGSLGTLAAGIAHELNNPLSILMGTIEAARDEIRSRQSELAGRPWCLQMENSLTEGLNVIERIKRIVADISSFGRPAAEKSGRADVRRVLEWAIQMTSQITGPRARVVAQLTDVPAVRGDETRLEQVFVNLLVNAAHAIEGERPGENEIRVAAGVDRQGRVVVEIQDSGKGMSKEVLKRIFDPFFTTKDAGRGTGLGLCICHGIVTSFGGEIGVESQTGKGSLFRVTLPAAPAEECAAEIQPEKVQTTVRGSILLIDDEAELRSVVQKALAAAHAVTAPETSREALEILRSGKQFDLIICDLAMPDVSGMDIYEEMLRIQPDQARRMVFASGGAFTPRTMEFLKSVQNPQIEKPFRPSALKKRVQELLNDWGPARTGQAA